MILSRPFASRSNGLSELAPMPAQQIRQAADAGYPQRRIAEVAGVSHTQIWRIVRVTATSDLPGPNMAQTPENVLAEQSRLSSLIRCETA